MNNGCEYYSSCFKCPLNWDCERTLIDQCDYEYGEGEYEMYGIMWDNGDFYK
jgi:hypothetical protein